MTKQVVRELYEQQTHLANVTQTHAAVQFGATYRMPDPASTRTFCDKPVKDGVVMREGTKVRCRVCRWIDAHYYGGDCEVCGAPVIAGECTNGDCGAEPEYDQRELLGEVPE